MEKQPKMEIRPGILKLFFTSLLFAAFVIGGIFVLSTSDDTMTRWLGGYLNILFFGGGGAFLIYRALSRPTMIVSSSGIVPTSVPHLSSQLIPWEDIQKIGMARQRILGYRTSTKQDYLAIYLKDAEKYDLKRIQANKAVTSVLRAIGNKMGVNRNAIYTASILLPKSVKKTLELFKDYPVHIDEKIEKI
jgi:hypothetical protein